MAEIADGLTTIALSDVFHCSLKDLASMTKSDALHRSCKAHGFFLITADANQEGVFSETADFFKLPVALRSKYKASHANQYLGYRGIGTEKSVMTGRPELCEQFKFGYLHDKESHSSTLHLDHLSAYDHVFKKSIMPYFNTAEQIATNVLTIIANNFNLGQAHFQVCCTQPGHQMGLNYYPANNAKELPCQNYAMSAHKDLCLLTIIAQDKAGLLLQDAKGEWKLIPFLPNTLLVMVGDYLERWTNSYYVSPLHQVLESSDSPRISIIYKHRPNYATVIPVIKGINPESTEDDREEFHTGKAYEKKITGIMEANR